MIIAAHVAPHRRGSGSAPRFAILGGVARLAPPEGTPVLNQTKSANNEVLGVFEPDERGSGHLRLPERNYAVRQDDVTIPASLIKQFQLCGGEKLGGTSGRGAGKRSAGLSLLRIDTINDLPSQEWCERTQFEAMTVIDPRKRIRFECAGGPMSMRVIDLMTPVGFGQRALIVAPPRTGKTVLLKQMAHGVSENHPEAHLMVLLIDERPEEVTEMRRAVNGEVVHSSNDHDIRSHVRIARLMIASAKRRIECGQHVVILLDSLTRLGRAFNAHIRGSGRIMSGGLDIRALTEPKAVFGAARNIEHGGSLTIIASALIETGSRMDEVIFNEFKGTGNMEIMLSRNLSNKRMWPAIDLQQSGTRKEELLLTEKELEKSHKIRRELVSRPADMMMETLLDRMQRHDTNAAFCAAP